MRKREQRGYIYKAFGSFHIRYQLPYADLPAEDKIKLAARCAAKGKPLPSHVQRSEKLCDAIGEHRGPTSKSVRDLALKVMDRINGLTPGETIQPDLTIVGLWEDEKHGYSKFVQDNLKPSTQHGYKQVWDQHLKGHFGKTRLRDYKTSMGSLFLTALAKDYGKRTVQNVRSLASGLFSYAVNIGKLDANPWHDCKVLGKSIEPAETKSYTLEEIENGITALVEHPDCQLILALAFFAGLRHGEISALQWDDFDAKAVHVRRNFARGQICSPKTKKSIRSVPLASPVKIAFALWKRKSGNGVWLFPGRTPDKPSDIRTKMSNIIQPAFRRNHIPWKAIHAGRRGLGTILTELTGDALASRDMLGHTTTKVTEDHYIGKIPEAGKKGMALLEAKIGSSK